MASLEDLKEDLKHESTGQPQPQAPPRFVRDENFVSSYANDVQFELGATDLTLTFGQTGFNKPTRQHTAMTMSWPEAKVMVYFLQANLLIYEAIEQRKITIPKGLIPPAPVMPEETEETATHMATAWEQIRKLHDELIASL